MMWNPGMVKPLLFEIHDESGAEMDLNVVKLFAAVGYQISVRCHATLEFFYQ